MNPSSNALSASTGTKKFITGVEKKIIIIPNEDIPPAHNDKVVSRKSTASGDKNTIMMVQNKWKIHVEMIEILFHITRSDVSQSRQRTSKPNEHTFDTLQSVLNEFNIMQLIHLVSHGIYFQQ
jgi:hypothetical protein